MNNPFDDLADDIYDDIISRCYDLDINNIMLNYENIFKYVMGADDHNILHIYIIVDKFDGNEGDYLSLRMKGSKYFEPDVQRWYIVDDY